MAQAKRIVLASRPVGEPKVSDFRLEDCPLPTPGEGEILLRTIWLSLDRQAPIADPARLSAARLLGTELVLVGGATLGGWASVELPAPHARLLDYLNASPQPFFAVWTHAATHYVNRAHVLYARPLD